MKLSTPCEAPEFVATDIYGKAISLEEYRGKPFILSFFRDAACPFCNLRVYEYTQKFKEWQTAGIDVIAVFSSSPEEVRKFVVRHPRPFRSVGDPNLQIYQKYGIGASIVGFIKAVLLKMKIVDQGKELGGKTNVKNPHPFLLPADFVIGPNLKVLDVWYGSDPTDHMPMERLERFVNKVRKARNKAANGAVAAA